MRPINGFERPGVQWMVIAGVVVLMALLVVTTSAVWRTRGQIDELLAAQRMLRADYEKLDAQVAREQSAREAFELEAARLRARETPAEARSVGPTLTLRPPEARGATPPEATVKAPDRAQAVQLRLVLPSTPGAAKGPFEVAARDWFTGRTLWTITIPKAAPTAHAELMLSAYVTGEMLAPGTYEFIVRMRDASAAPEAVASYEVSIGG